ncbi:MAG: hypothetical protein JWP35_1226 [Caulobacter sp.]|nr:hypothetical protein [Caulobacter sp.]
MAPSVLIALLLLFAGDEAPVATQARPATPSKTPPPAVQPILSAMPASMQAPADDYGYVSWCYGALSGYLSLYDQAMPEVTRIEKEFPGPDGIDADLKIYPELRATARGDLKLYASAIEAAEKASPKLISPYGAAAAKRGVAIWNGAKNAPPAKLAQMWMSWSPPEKCEVTARKLKTQASVLGQALAYNTPDAASLDTPDAPAPMSTAQPLMATTVSSAPLQAPAMLAPLPPTPAPQAPEPAAMIASPAQPTPTAAEPPPAANIAPKAETAPPAPTEAPAAPEAATPMPAPSPPEDPPMPQAAEDTGVWYHGVP